MTAADEYQRECERALGEHVQITAVANVVMCLCGDWFAVMPGGSPGDDRAHRAHVAQALAADPGVRAAVEREARGGAGLIAAERRRQIEIEGYTIEHDAQHSADELLDAAIAYLSPNDACAWPWSEEAFKPEAKNDYSVPWHKRSHIGTVRDLTKAGALIAALIDTLRYRQEPSDD
jgi:hypothetical protein